LQKGFRKDLGSRRIKYPSACDRRRIKGQRSPGCTVPARAGLHHGAGAPVFINERHFRTPMFIPRHARLRLFPIIGRLSL
jgi:hypothetical protein